jgi:prepilin-type processing-associated H-X9-DG protein
MACASVLVILTSIALARQAAPGAAAHALTLKDATQLRGIHQSYLVFAREFQGIMPRPGLIDRLPLNGVEEPGRGPEDISQNTTAALHSACIMQNYYTADIIISPVERNTKVVRVDADYDYQRYNVLPNVDSYWDANFKADLATESNVSYANLVIFGKRMENQWRDSLDPKFSVLGNRGPKDGAIDPQSLTCGPHGNWAGNVVFNDNHVEFLDTTQPPALKFKDAQEQERPDNLFAIDDGMAGGDVILSFTRTMTKDGAELQWD